MAVPKVNCTSDTVTIEAMAKAKPLLPKAYSATARPMLPVLGYIIGDSSTRQSLRSSGATAKVKRPMATITSRVPSMVRPKLPASISAPLSEARISAGVPMLKTSLVTNSTG